MYEYIEEWENDKCKMRVNGVEYRIVYMTSLWSSKGFYKVIGSNLQSNKLSPLIRKLEKIKTGGIKWKKRKLG